MQHRLGKWVWKGEGRENRESETSLTQKMTENNDLGMLEQFFYSQLDVAQDRPKTGPRVSPE
jgi:hypothetical protein